VPLFVLLINFCVSLSSITVPLMLKLNNGYDGAITNIIFCASSICKYRKSKYKVSFPCPYLTRDVGRD